MLRQLLFPSVSLRVRDAEFIPSRSRKTVRKTVSWECRHGPERDRGQREIERKRQREREKKRERGVCWGSREWVI